VFSNQAGKKGQHLTRGTSKNAEMRKRKEIREGGNRDTGGTILIYPKEKGGRVTKEKRIKGSYRYTTILVTCGKKLFRNRTVETRSGIKIVN